MGIKNLKLIQLEIRPQLFDNIRRSVALDFQPDSVALAPVMQLGTHAFKQAA